MSHHDSKGLARTAVLLLALFLLIGPGCSSSDDDVLTPPDQTETVALHYDAANSSSPLLTSATYEAAARFTSAKTGALAGGKLTEVKFYISSAPDSCKVKVYGANTATAPGALLYSADVTATVAGSSWNTHVLTSPVTVPNGDLWISIEFADTVSQPTIGCDPGPRVQDGDWLFASTDGTWTPFNQRFAVSVNWNIRGTVKVTS